MMADAVAVARRHRPPIVQATAQRADAGEGGAVGHVEVARDFPVQLHGAAVDVDVGHVRDLLIGDEASVRGQVEVQAVGARAAVDRAGDGAAAHVDCIVARSGVDLAVDDAAGVDLIVSAAGFDGILAAADIARVVDHDGPGAAIGAEHADFVAHNGAGVVQGAAGVFELYAGVARRAVVVDAGSHDGAGVVDRHVARLAGHVADDDPRPARDGYAGMNGDQIAAGRDGQVSLPVQIESHQSLTLKESVART